jgi:uncharacterized damage-inducible protein DinB
MNKEYFTGLAGYTNWADNKSMEWLDQISDEQWEQVIVSSFSSIRQTAVHIASAQKIWIDFWNNAPHPVYLSAEFKGTLFYYKRHHLNSLHPFRLTTIS